MSKWHDDLIAMGYSYETVKTKENMRPPVNITTEYYEKDTVCLLSRRVGVAVKRWHLYIEWDKTKKCGKILKYEFKFHRNHIESYLQGALADGKT